MCRLRFQPPRRNSFTRWRIRVRRVHLENTCTKFCQIWERLTCDKPPSAVACLDFTDQRPDQTRARRLLWGGGRVAGRCSLTPPARAASAVHAPALTEAMAMAPQNLKPRVQSQADERRGVRQVRRWTGGRACLRIAKATPDHSVRPARAMKVAAHDLDGDAVAGRPRGHVLARSGACRANVGFVFSAFVSPLRRHHSHQFDESVQTRTPQGRSIRSNTFPVDLTWCAPSAVSVR
jgi:hypothetical protein